MKCLHATSKPTKTRINEGTNKIVGKDFIVGSSRLTFLNSFGFVSTCGVCTWYPSRRGRRRRLKDQGLPPPPQGASENNSDEVE